LSKRFRFNETVGLQIRAEAFNVLNRANYFLGTGVGDGATGENTNAFNVNSTTFGVYQHLFAAYFPVRRQV
jgi:hypothetical protein